MPRTTAVYGRSNASGRPTSSHSRTLAAKELRRARRAVKTARKLNRGR
jgi:hypothetical protein